MKMNRLPCLQNISFHCRSLSNTCLRLILLHSIAVKSFGTQTFLSFLKQCIARSHWFLVMSEQSPWGPSDSPSCFLTQSPWSQRQSGLFALHSSLLNPLHDWMRSHLATPPLGWVNWQCWRRSRALHSLLDKPEQTSSFWLQVRPTRSQRLDAQSRVERVLQGSAKKTKASSPSNESISYSSRL